MILRLNPETQQLDMINVNFALIIQKADRAKNIQIQKKYHHNYLLVGPYFHTKVKGEFEEEAVPEEYKEICDILNDVGIVIHYGTWLTEGRSYSTGSSTVHMFSDDPSMTWSAE